MPPSVYKMFTLFMSSAQIQFIILVNCGANIDVIELLQPRENVVFFICDRCFADLCDTWHLIIYLFIWLFTYSFVCLFC